MLDGEITASVTVIVVDRLHVIEIKKRERGRLRVAVDERHGPIELRHKCPPIVNTGQRIGEGHLGQFFHPRLRHRKLLTQG